jgi:arsenate reductase
MTTIYHNPRCSKSRQTLQLLRDNGIEPDIVLYLESPIDRATLLDLLDKLNLSAGQLVRRSEQEFKDRNLGRDGVTEEQLIAAMLDCPKLIERPIVVVGNSVRLGRPPENVLEIIDV